MEFTSKNFFNSIITWLFAFVTVMQCSSVYDSSFLGEIFINLMWQILLFIICLKSFSMIYRCSINYYRFHKLIIFLLLYSLISFIVLLLFYINHVFTIYYIMLFLIDPLMLMVICFNSQLIIDIFNKIEIVILILAVVSLLFWILNMFGLPANSHIVIKWGGIPHAIPGFFGVDFLAQGGNNFLGYSLMRNTGLFVEAPVYSYVLCIALFMELFIKKHESNFKILLLLITIFSTTSTTGLLIALPAIFYSKIMLFKNLLTKILSLISLPFIMYLLKYIFNSKINDYGSSYIQRTNELDSDFIVWKNHMIIGGGLPNIGSGGSNTASIGLSSGFMVALAFGGIVLGMFYIIPTLMSFVCSEKIIGLSIFSFILFMFTIAFNFYVYIMILLFIWSCILFKNKVNYS